MHYFLKSLLVAVLFTFLGAEAQQVNTVGNSEVKVSGFYNTISRKDGDQQFLMVVDEYQGGQIFRQNICTAGIGFEQTFDHRTIFECQSTGRTRIRFEPERTFGSFKKILDYARRVSNRDDGSSSGVEHTFDLQFKKFNSMNNLLFYLRRVRDGQTGRWSKPVAVRANEYTCEAFEQVIRCMWIPEDRNKESVNWVDYGPEFTEG